MAAEKTPSSYIGSYLLISHQKIRNTGKFLQG